MRYTLTITLPKEQTQRAPRGSSRSRRAARSSTVSKVTKEITQASELHREQQRADEAVMCRVPFSLDHQGEVVCSLHSLKTWQHFWRQAFPSKPLIFTHTARQSQSLPFRVFYSVCRKKLRGEGKDRLTPGCSLDHQSLQKPHPLTLKYRMQSRVSVGVGGVGFPGIKVRLSGLAANVGQAISLALNTIHWHEPCDST